MFTQEKLKKTEETLSPVTCTGCTHACRISAIRDDYGVVYPTIGIKVIKCYIDHEGTHQVIFPYTCPTFKSAQRLGTQIATMCDKYKQNSR
jgi:hypothetical protein